MAQQTTADTESEDAVEQLTISGYPDLESTYYLLTSHARVLRRDQRKTESDVVFNLASELKTPLRKAGRAVDTPGEDHTDITVAYEGEDIDVILRAFATAVETGPESAVTEDDVAFARSTCRDWDEVSGSSVTGE